MTGSYIAGFLTKCAERGISSPEELDALYSKLKYRILNQKTNRPFFNTNRDTFEKWHLLSPEQIKKHKIGVCWDTAAMTDAELTRLGVPHENYFAHAKDAYHKPTHAFNVYKDENGDWRWIEGSWEKYKGNDWKERRKRDLVRRIVKALESEGFDEATGGDRQILHKIERFPEPGVDGRQFYDAMLKQPVKQAESEEERRKRAREFVEAVRKMALKRKLNYFLVTDGASGISNNGNPAVRNAREAQIKWELEHGADPYEDWSKQAQAYEPPWTIDQIRKNLGDEVADRLLMDPVHKWRSDTGIELVHKEPTKRELRRIIANWRLMSDEQKRLSDEKSRELFGVTNEENARRLLGGRRRETWESGEGEVESYTPNKTEDHDEIVIRLNDGRRVRISNNTRLGKILRARVGSRVGYHGYRVGGTNVVHRVHPNAHLRGGWLEQVKAAFFKT